jgi:hypothetical protein
MTPEGKVKAYLRTECKKRRYICRALIASMENKWPDRGIFGPNGRIAWVEVKSDEANLETAHCKEQKAKIEQLIREGGFACMVVGKSGVDALLNSGRLEEWFEQ